MIAGADGTAKLCAQTMTTVSSVGDCASGNVLRQMRLPSCKPRHLEDTQTLVAGWPALCQPTDAAPSFTLQLHRIPVCIQY